MEMALLGIVMVAAAFATAALSAVAGFGGGVLLLPVFVAVLGTRDAVAVLTVAQLASNGSRVWFNRREVERRLVGIFALGAVPAAAAGALLFATAPLTALTRVIGVFLLIMVAWRRWKPNAARLDDRAFAAVGAASGFGSALVGSVGPMVAPFFLARGLLRGAYIGTEAASAVVMHLTKLVVFGAAAVLTATSAAIGLPLPPPARPAPGRARRSSIGCRPTSSSSSSRWAWSPPDSCWPSPAAERASRSTRCPFDAYLGRTTLRSAADSHNQVLSANGCTAGPSAANCI